MPRTYVDLTHMRQIGNDCKNVARSVDEVYDKLLRVVRQLDWDVRGQENINATANKIGLMLESYANVLKSYKTFIDEAYKQYSTLEKTKTSGRTSLDSISLDTAKHEDYTSEILKFMNNIFQMISKKSDSSDMGLFSNVFSYIRTLYDTMLEPRGDKDSSIYDIMKNSLSLLKGGTKLEEGLYNYFLKNLKAMEGFELYNSWGNTISGLAIIGSLIGVADKSVDFVEAVNNKSNNIYDIIGSGIETSGSIVNFLGNVYMVKECSSKILSYVGDLNSGSLQLITENAAKVQNISTALTIADSYISGISAGVKEYGEVTADGKFDIGDCGSVLMTTGIKGLSTLISNKTYGLINIDAEGVVDYIQTSIQDNAADWWKQHPEMKNYVQDDSQPYLLRLGASCFSVVTANITAFVR